MFNLARHCLLDPAARPGQGERTALVLVDEEGDHCWTFDEIAQEVERVAHGLLRLGLQRGDRVLIRLPNCAEYAIAFFASCLAGLVPIPSSPLLSPSEVRFLVEDSGARCLVTSPSLGQLDSECPIRVIVVGEPGSWESLREGAHGSLPDTHPEDPAYLIYTSGTTARPKGVLHAHRSAHGRAIVIREWEDLRPGDVVLHAGMLNWTYTLGVGLMDPWSVGATSVLYAGRKDPMVWPRLIRKHHVTVFAAVPTVFRQMLKYSDTSPEDWISLRHALSAGEPLPVSVREEFNRRTGRELYEALGMSEISTYISFKPGMRPKPGACGVPQAGRPIRLLAVDSMRDARVGEVGRIAVHRSDPGLMIGYWNRPGEQSAAFEGEWFLGGDLASCDDDGVWWFHGRNDDIIKSLGYRVSPIEVEAAIAQAPGVAECAVAAVDGGEPGLRIITGFVRMQQGHAFDASALDVFARSRLASYKCPRSYVRVDELPRTANGKVMRAALASR